MDRVFFCAVTVSMILLMSVGCSTVRSRDMEERKTRKIGREVKVAFGTKGYHFKTGVPGTLGHPIQAFLRLYVVKGSQRRMIRKKTELRGLVEIRSPKEALSFCRFLTGPDTHFLFNDVGYVEVFREDDKDSHQYFARLKPQLWKKLKLEPATAYKTGDHFTVERTLLSYPDPKTKLTSLFRSSETVGREGEYRLEKKSIVCSYTEVDLFVKTHLLLPHYR